MKSKAVVLSGAIAGLLMCALATESSVKGRYSVTGNGDDDTSAPAVKFEAKPGAVYGISCAVRHPEGPDGGVAVVRTLGCNFYQRVRGGDWIPMRHVVPAPATAKNGDCTVRQWHIPGLTEFTEIEVAEVEPVYRRIGGAELGYGESVDGDRYHFGLKLADRNHGHSRALRGYRKLSLDSATQFADGAEMAFEHELGGRELTAGWMSLVCKDGDRGRIVAEVSADGADWTEVVSVTNATVCRLPLPARFFPAKRLLARVRGEGAGCDLRLRQYSFDAKFAGERLFAFGATEYRRKDGGGTVLELKPEEYLEDVSSGARLPGTPSGVTAWIQSSGRKVFRGRPVPAAESSVFAIAAARNEAEAKQLVLRSDEAVEGVRVTAEIDPEIEVEIGYVGYQFVDFTADAMGARGRWPDPIHVQTAGGIRLDAGDNQPFWVRAKPSKSARPGIHRGRLLVSALPQSNNQTIPNQTIPQFSLPLEVEVFDFALPDRMSCETSFGLTWSRVYEYQHIVSPEDKRTVSEKYLAHYAKHHISPYHPFPMVADPSWTMKWTKPADPRDAEPVLDWTKYDAEVERVLSTYHFNTFVFSLRGVGGGDIMGTHGKPKMNGAEQGTELYELYMERYLKAVEAHLKEKGWLGMAYAYVYDEPLKEHYAYVNENLGRIRRYAPGIRRMVTVEPREEFGDNISLWCPITEEFDGGKSRVRQANGDDVWWYITFSSVQPKVNEHIEHSGVDMRVWLWQTWLEQVTGVLIWETVHWNGKRVYPDPEKPQNPYEDSICWGGKSPWNTGEGRYVYPPTACFGTKAPVLEGPVDSIRFEMLREGLEDYEYFAMLKRLAPEHPLLKVPVEVTGSLTEYSRDPAAMEAYRVRLARAIEELERRKTR